MKALTVRQPWAWAIAAGHKDVENRTWITKYRGPLAIHAAVAWDIGGEDVCRSLLEDYGVLATGEPYDKRELLVTGAVIAVVDLVDVCEDLRCRCSGWAAIGTKHWKVRNARPLFRPVPMNGQLGLWNVDLDLDGLL